VLGGAFSTNVAARTRTELVFLVTVNVDEPSSVVPVDADAQPSPPAPAAPRADRFPRVQRIDALGATS
jgi:hypothetical protein